jgi:hypothetical protein
VGQLPDLSIIFVFFTTGMVWMGAVDDVQFAVVCSLESYLILGLSLMVVEAKECLFCVILGTCGFDPIYVNQRNDYIYFKSFMCIKKCNHHWLILHDVHKG